uniref:Galectin n=1 Tax=Rhipicephalus microplus TaxID=6941 RepID=A0A6M2CJF2_RHIMP
MQMTAAKVSSVHSLPLYPEPRLVTFEPAMPMDHPLEKLQPGTIIELSGHVLGSPKRFSINLVTAGGDIALHVNPRFDVGNTVFNTFRSDDWEQEEVVQRLPVQQGHNFDFMILVEEMGYKVAFNGLHFADFKHRLLFSAVERLKVDGCVTVHRVEQRPPLGDPVPPMEGCQQPEQPLPVEPCVVYNPSTPFLYMLPGGRLKPGLMVYVSGRPHSEATSFSLNFQCGGLGSDIAFHFNPRFHRKEMVRNSFQDGDWGTEERKCHGFPFTPGVHFDVLIRVLDATYDVAVNGQHYLQFQHRLQPLQRVSHFQVEGDVLLASCKFQHC